MLGLLSIAMLALNSEQPTQKDVCAEAKRYHKAINSRPWKNDRKHVKALSEALLATAGCGDRENFHHILSHMEAMMDLKDKGPESIWIRGRIVLGLVWAGADLWNAKALEKTFNNIHFDHHGVMMASIGSLATGKEKSWDPVSGWGLAYLIIAEPKLHANHIDDLRHCEEVARKAARADPKQVSTLLWTHAMNSFAAATALDPVTYSETINAMLQELSVKTVMEAVMQCPENGYRREHQPPTPCLVRPLIAGACPPQISQPLFAFHGVARVLLSHRPAHDHGSARVGFGAASL
jgi:hypothetical protein